METAPLKSFATWARTALIREVTARVAVVLAPASPGRVEQPKAVDALEKAVNAAGGGDKGRTAVADRVAYTWFNRIIALRFMDANGYTGTGIVSPQGGTEGGQPEILAEAKRGNIDAAIVGTKTREAVTGLLNGTRRSEDPQGEAYALLLADYCRHWNRAMPFMFEREGDFTELLIPANLLADDSVLNRAVKVLTADFCQDVEVIGWLYQFYISERHDEVLADFKKNKKAGADEIPAATQLFTPHWIVRYLVENSLGRLWLLNRPSSRLLDQMEYYITPVDKETDFLKISSPEELKVIDPACGSGHMLTYAFDLLYAIYEEEGYAPAEIPELILTNNLYGVEIDPRAGALAAFALTMKARGRQRTFFNKQVEPNVCVLDPIHFTPQELDLLLTADGDRDAEAAFWSLFEHAETFGSLIQPDLDVMARLTRHAEQLDDGWDMFKADVVERAKRVVMQANYLAPRYAVVVTNPPYMGSGNMGGELSTWIKAEYGAGKQDLYGAFVLRALTLVNATGLVAMIIGDSWMAIKTFADFRSELLARHTFQTFLHLRDSAYHADIFGANAAFVLTKYHVESARCVFVRLEPLEIEAKRVLLLEAIRNPESSWRYQASASDLTAIPSAPISYWASPAARRAFLDHGSIADVMFSDGLTKTGDNARYMRYWWEVSLKHASDTSVYRPCAKGGSARDYYGNTDVLIDWTPEARAHYGADRVARITPERLWDRPGITWTKISSRGTTFRLLRSSDIPETAGPALYLRDGVPGDVLYSALGLLASTANWDTLPLINPTLNFQTGDVLRLPFSSDVMLPAVTATKSLVSMAAEDWNLVETSSGYATHAFLAAGFGALSIPARLVSTRETFAKRNAEYLDLQSQVDETAAAALGVTPGERSAEDVTLFSNPRYRYPTLSPEIVDDALDAQLVQELVSYAVGCMFGRYSLDKPGLILADQGSTLQDYLAKVPNPTFAPNEDNVLPIVDGDWFEDDIVARFRKFLRVAFGEQHFEENLRFVTESLRVKDLRDYFVKSFYEDHWKRYRKRPIYWFFSSLKGSFNALIYMHRYTPSTTSTVLNEYLREYKAKLESSLQHHVRLAVGGGAPRQLAAAQKEADRLRKVLLELDEYEHRVLYPLASQQLSIDLDDGVKVNYSKFGAALKEIPGLEASE
jgi:hypothetical protein